MRPISTMALAATNTSYFYLYTPAYTRAASAKVSPHPHYASPASLSTPVLHTRPWGGLSSPHFCGIVSLPCLRAKKSVVLAAVGTEDFVVEPVTSVKFPTSISAPGGSQQLSLVGTGIREKTIAFIRVKVYAVGVYFDTGISASLSAWKGKAGEELSKDATFFKAIAEAPVEKSIKIVLVRDVDGATFWGALDEALTPRLKAANAGPSGQEALDAFGEVFRGRPLKQGTSIYLSWIRPSKLQVAVSGDGLIPRTLEASIGSAALVSALFDVYLGESPVSPTAKASIASGLAALI